MRLFWRGPTIPTTKSAARLGATHSRHTLSEFDIHDNDFVEEGGYRLGHYAPGDGVAQEENGVGLLLGDWLGLVSEWSSESPEHAPILLVLDLKDNLTDNSGPHEGNMGALNQQIFNAFGDRLYTAREQSVDGWPSAHELRGRVIVQLSGDALSRERYLRDSVIVRR